MRAKEFILENTELKPMRNSIPYPKGTTKIDVSDVYDWYKLGMAISDLKHSNPEEFGKGPPQTAIVFGTEKEEHKFAPQLKRLGLKMHDIDQPTDGDEENKEGSEEEESTGEEPGGNIASVISGKTL